MKTTDEPHENNRLATICIVALVILGIGAGFVGFIWLPSKQKDFQIAGFWDGICRAAGVSRSWTDRRGAPIVPTVSTNVILLPEMTRTASSTSVGRGATLALNCTMCHGAQGMSRSDAPNLAGQYPEVISKQLNDYKSGKRSSSIMSALAQGLSAQSIAELSAYYASLPKARTAPTTYDETLPALVRVGDPMRNIAPCISCHGGVDQKLGAPWLEGMPAPYVVEQLTAFKSGNRRNDSEQQMRNMARLMTPEEIEQVAHFYARKSENHLQ